MKIIPLKITPVNTALFCVFSGALGLAKHPFVKNLPTADREYLAVFQRQSQLGLEATKSLVLPSGRQLVMFGIGALEKFNHRKAMLLMRRVVGVAKSEKIKSFTVFLPDFRSRGVVKYPLGVAGQLATQLTLANFEFNEYREKPKEGWPEIEEVGVVNPAADAKFSKALAEGVIIGEEINKARALSNTPGADMTPHHLAEAASAAGKEAGFLTRVLNEVEIEKLGMGGVMGVSRGSSERPRFIVMEYWGGAKSKAPVVLVGKGVTFDTGGLNLKPSSSIYEMHMDMSGGAAVIHTIAALARLGVKKNIVGLVPAVENAISGSSYRPGDLLKTMGGKTIEVLDTDAEGRVILADALCYARAKYTPSLVIDVATLTGAAVVALGQRISAIFSTNETISKNLMKSGEEAGDYLWPLPLWEEYEADIKGTFGDVANIGKTRWGGAITGAAFLWQFIKDTASSSENKKSSAAPEWVHIDMAPRMTTIEGEYLAKGAAGSPVAALVNFLLR